MNGHHNKRLMFPKRGERLDKKLFSVLFIDPGIGGTGFAFFEELTTSPRKLESPTSIGVVVPKKSIHWQARVKDICAWFDGLCSRLQPRVVVLEWPEVWEGSMKSQASATSGNLGKLFYLVGGLGEVARRNCPCLPVLVSAKEWKGQLSKKAVGMRLNRKLPLRIFKNHEEDAVAMGLAAQGLL